MLDCLWFLLFLVLVAGVPYMYSKKGIKFCIGIAYVAGVIIYAHLFNVCYGNSAIAPAFVFSAQLFTFGVNGKELVEMLNSVYDKVTMPFVFCVWAAYLVCPVLTVGAVLSYIKRGLDRTTLRSRFFKDVYIFTEKNENALILAKDICNKNKRAVIVFADSAEPCEECEGFVAMNVAYSAHEVFSLLNKTNKVQLCFNDTDTGKCLDKLNGFLVKERKKKAEIYVFSDNPMAYEVVDGIKTDMQNVCIRTVSTHAIMTRNILWDYPLFSKMDKADELNVTVLGVSNFGGYFAMNTLWCSIMPDCKMKLNLVDYDTTDNILRRVSDNIPDGYFDIEIFNDNINTNSFFDKISKTRLQKSDYILVSMGNDDLNISISRKIRLYFERTGREPFIVTVLKNQSKYTVMKEALKKEGIAITGGAKNIYCYENIFEDRFFRKAFKVFSLVESNYGNVVTEESFYKQKQIDILSSYANAIHCKYKVYALCGKCDVTGEEIQSALKVKRDKIVDAEHNRWVVFEILKGFIGIAEENLEAFFEYNRNSEKNNRKIHKNESLKMHACITDIKGVEKVDRLIEEKYGIKQNLKEIDEMIADKTAEIWFENGEAESDV